MGLKKSRQVDFWSKVLQPRMCCDHKQAQVWLQPTLRTWGLPSTKRWTWTTHSARELFSISLNVLLRPTNSMNNTEHFVMYSDSHFKTKYRRWSFCGNSTIGRNYPQRRWIDWKLCGAKVIEAKKRSMIVEPFKVYYDGVHIPVV